MEVIKEMSIGELLKWIAGITAGMSVFIQITPIKWNPLSSLLRWIGEKLNEGTMKEVAEIKKEITGINSKVDNLEQKVSEVRDDMASRLDEAEANREEDKVCIARTRILRFGGESIRGINHTKEEFDNVLVDIDNYEKYCTDHPKFPNNKTVAITNRIKEMYNDCLVNNSFLS